MKTHPFKNLPYKVCAASRTTDKWACMPQMGVKLHNRQTNC